MHDENTLRRHARQAIEEGKLPRRFPDRTWGGPGFGDCCSICSSPVTGDELELEIEFARGFGRDRHHVHIRCFAAWEFELRELKRNDETTSSSEPDPRNTASRPGLLERPDGRKMDPRGDNKIYTRGAG
jgi:hypothetical protein